MHLDSRIGELNNGQFYAFANGYDKPEIRGSLSEVMVALGLVQAFNRYDVVLRFQYPAWDEMDGIFYPDIEAKSKAAAINQARILAAADGHTQRGKGRYWFTAEFSV